MKRIYLILLISLGVLLSSCAMEELQTGEKAGEREVEISIATSGSSATRAPLDGEDTDVGDADGNEKRIDELDLLVFDEDGKYMYRREAYKLANSADTWRAMLSEYWDEMTIHFLANSRAILMALEAGSDAPVAGSTTWTALQTKLIDTNPARLVNTAAYQPLPMWGTGTVTLDPDLAPNKMTGIIQMLRSVASFDVYVLDGTIEANKATKDFTLTDIYAAYAADRGYLAAVATLPATDPVTYTIPAAMGTTAGNSGQLKATGVKSYTTEQGDFKGIAYQLYVYDNYANTVPADPTQNRPTRLIVSGYYKQTGDPLGWVKSYYPVDVTFNDTGEYRPVIRNWKYEFMVTSVTGPGKPTLEEALEAQNMDMNINIIQWDKNDVQIGVTGKYYVTMDKRAASLWRNAGARQVLELDYRFIDGLTANDFTFDFKKDEDGENYAYDNGDVVLGTPVTVGDVTTTIIRNEWFEVTMMQTPGIAGGDVSFEVKALQDYNADHDEDVVVVKYRNLEFEISINQYDISEEDWQDGGLIPADV